MNKNISLFILTIFLSINVFAQGNGGSISVQGVLRQANGSAAADGQYAVTFSIWNQESGGSMVWGSGNEGYFSDLVVKNGVYNAELEVGGFLNAGGDHWLEVQVGSETLSPRLKLNVTPYEQLFLANAHNVVLESGPVGLGTQSPADDAYLDVAGGRIRDVTGFVAPVGSVTMFAGTTAPDGWLLLDGTWPSDYWVNPIYSDLRNLLGTSYGTDWGTLPDMRSRMPAGYDERTHYFNDLKDSFGRQAPTHRSHGHSVSANQSSHSHSIPDHNHGITDPGHNHTGDSFHHYQWDWDGNYGPGDGGGWGNSTVDHNTTGITINNGGAGNTNTTDPGITITQSNSSDVGSISGNGDVETNHYGTDAVIGNMPPYRVFTFIIKY